MSAQAPLTQAQDAQRIADMFADARLVIASCGVFIPLLNDPELWTAFRGWQSKNLASDQPPFLSFPRRDGTLYEMDLDATVANVTNNPGFTMIVILNAFTVMLPDIAHALSQRHYFTNSPELEFFRHLRNAVSHGNKFHFTNNKINHPARFGAYEITPALEGQRALFAFINPGDVLDLFDEIERQLRQMHGHSLVT